MARYRLTRYSPTDVFNATGSRDNYESFFEAFADDCRDDFEEASSMTFVSGDAQSIVFDVPDEHQPAFAEMIADLNPTILERITDQ